MADSLQALQALLQGLRERFIDELPERCDGLEHLILQLESSPQDRSTFDELFRSVHSLKGSGGTHGLPVITTICHHLESLLAEAGPARACDRAFATQALAHIDLLRQAATLGRSDNPDYAELESAAASLRQSALQDRKAGLIAESSLVMLRIFEKALDRLPVHLTVVDNGLLALEHLIRQRFDFLIAGREIEQLNGIALVTALRATSGANRRIPAILITSNHADIPAHAEFSAVLARDQALADNLVAALQPVLRG